MNHSNESLGRESDFSGRVVWESWLLGHRERFVNTHTHTHTHTHKTLHNWIDFLYIYIFLRLFKVMSAACAEVVREDKATFFFTVIHTQR